MLRLMSKTISFEILSSNNMLLLGRGHHLPVSSFDFALDFGVGHEISN